MAAESGTTNDGMFKRRYGGMQRPIPEHNKFQLAIKFSDQNKLGDDYQETVRVARPFGWTWAGVTSRRTVYSLANPVAGQTAPARVKGLEFVCRDQIPYGLLDQVSTEQAFANVMDEIVMSMDESAAFAKELAIMYAGSHLGVIESDPGTSAVPQPVTITAATFAPGIWAQAQGMPVDVYASDLTTIRGTTNTLTVHSFGGTRSTLKLTGTQATFDAIQANDVIVPAGVIGEWAGANTAGIEKILSNTGTLFEIAGATYPIWLATPYPAGSVPCSLSVLTQACANSLGVGGMGKIRFYVSHFAWTDMNNDHAALRVTTEKEGKDLHIGASRITYEGPTGIIEIETHPMLKAGQAWGLRLEHWKRGGVQDYSHAMRGPDGKVNDNLFFRPVPDKAGLEVQGWWDQYPAFCSQPSKQIYVTGIENNSLT